MNVSTKIQQCPIDKLIPYARNARTHSAEQIAQVAASIREFGFTNPILVDGESGVLAGHARLLAARQLKLTEVPVVVLDRPTPEMIKSLRSDGTLGPDDTGDDVCGLHTGIGMPDRSIEDPGGWGPANGVAAPADATSSVSLEIESVTLSMAFAY